MTGLSRSPPVVIMTLRLWQEVLGHERSEWRGEIKNLATGEVRYFRQWDEIAEIVPKMLSNAEGSHNEIDTEASYRPHEKP